MKIIINFVIFCIVLFIYLHVQFHLKTGEELEIYEIDQLSKDKFEEICDLRQPIIFTFDCDPILNASSKREYLLTNYPTFELKIREKNKATSTDLYAPLTFQNAAKLFDEDKTSSYYTENNTDFLDETGVIKNLKYNDDFLRPYMVSNCMYDIMMGSQNTTTPFRYEINYRNFFHVTEGVIKVKMSPPHSSKYLYPIYDYDNFEFRSHIDPWNPQTNYVADFSKVKCLEFTVNCGSTLFIPAYWWYSIKFEQTTSSVSCFKYRTYMNNVTIIPYFAMHILQLQNVKHNIVKKYNTSRDDPSNITATTETVPLNSDLYSPADGPRAIM